MLKYILFFLVTPLAFWAQAYKPVKDTTALKVKIENMNKTTTTMESDFTQEKNLSLLSEKIISKGHFAFKKDNLLRWEYKSPTQYLIIINKDKVFIKDLKKTSKYDMNSNKVFKEINDLMLSCVQGTVFKSNKFKTHYFENDKGFKLEMIPQSKNMKETFKKINLYFDKSVTSVTKMEMVELTEDQTTIEFYNKKTNVQLAENIFTVK